MKKPPTPFGYVIFCDDRREEKSGKETFIGVYQQALIVDSLPGIIPGIVAIIDYCETAGESDDPVSLRIEIPSEDAAIGKIEQKVDIEKLRTAENRKSGRLLKVRSIFQFGPLPLVREGDILISVKRGELEFELGRLTIQLKSA